MNGITVCMCACVCVCLQYKDLLQLMIDATGEDEDNEEKEGQKLARKLTDNEIVSHSVTFLLAGYETTANTLAFTSYLLALNPEIQEKLQREIDDYFEEKPVSRNLWDFSPHSVSQFASFNNLLMYL